MNLVAALASAVVIGLVVDALYRAIEVGRRRGRLDSMHGGNRSSWLVRTCLGNLKRLPPELVEPAVRELEGAGVLDGRGTLARRQAAGGVLGVAASAGVLLLIGWSSWFIVIPVLGAAYMGPALWLARRRMAKVRRILAQFPDFLEYVACCSEAGLALLPALELAAEKLGGSLGHELRAVMPRAHGIGGTGEALRELATRLDNPMVSSVTASLAFAERLGTPVASLMRRQRQALATMRRQIVGTRIGEASSRLAVCAVFLLLPATLAVVIVPNVIGLVTGRW